MGIRTAMYYPDFHFDHPGVDPESFFGYDLFVTTKSFQLDYLTALPGMSRVAYIPHGFCPDVHRPVFDQMRDTDFRADVAHTGNPSAYKLAWVEAVATMPASVSVALVGNRWEGFVRDRRLTDCRVTGELLGIAYAQAIQTARINVAMHFGPVANGWQDLVSTRTFEIPACGGFMLHIDNAEVREFYDVGQEIDVFSSHEELRDKVRYYLARPELRMRMAERAHARCVPAYSYVTRAAEMSELLADCR
jgi:spore maturation protein CgeB